MSANRKWTAAEDALLGKLSDSEVARRIGVTPLSIFNRCKRLRVPAFMKRVPSTPFPVRSRESESVSCCGRLESEAIARIAAQVNRRKVDKRNERRRVFGGASVDLQDQAVNRRAAKAPERRFRRPGRAALPSPIKPYLISQTR